MCDICRHPKCVCVCVVPCCMYVCVPAAEDATETPQGKNMRESSPPASPNSSARFKLFHLSFILQSPYCNISAQYRHYSPHHLKSKYSNYASDSLCADLMSQFKIKVIGVLAYLFVILAHRFRSLAASFCVNLIRILRFLGGQVI